MGDSVSIDVFKWCGLGMLSGVDRIWCTCIQHTCMCQSCVGVDSNKQATKVSVLKFFMQYEFIIFCTEISGFRWYDMLFLARTLGGSQLCLVSRNTSSFQYHSSKLITR